mmetsp:Transcript_32887/g.75227  ORF Transcript_32887/g.75227 Transcript_32887/m.75227 type:complete len:225 (-) Transcript_32887:871-1545(-)
MLGVMPSLTARPSPPSATKALSRSFTAPTATRAQRQFALWSGRTKASLAEGLQKILVDVQDTAESGTVVDRALTHVDHRACPWRLLRGGWDRRGRATLTAVAITAITIILREPNQCALCGTQVQRLVHQPQRLAANVAAVSVGQRALVVLVWHPGQRLPEFERENALCQDLWRSPRPWCHANSQTQPGQPNVRDIGLLHWHDFGRPNELLLGSWNWFAETSPEW